MNMFKKNGGFTLVELIVVIAILAILAGVAVPAYSGYITKAKEAADISACDAIKTAVFAVYSEKGASMPAVIVVEDHSVKVGATEQAAEALSGNDLTAFNTYYGATMSTINIDSAKAVWTGGAWTLTKSE